MGDGEWRSRIGIALTNALVMMAFPRSDINPSIRYPSRESCVGGPPRSIPLRNTGADMHNLSVYTATYNLSLIGFDWKSTLTNWTAFLQGHSQIVIAVNTSTDSTYEDICSFICELKKDQRNQTDYQVVKTDIPLSNPLFDGLIKNEALKRCTGEFATLLDIDEVVPLTTRQAWEGAMEFLSRSTYDALLIPSIDLFHDEKSFKSLNSKWYIHKNRPHIIRGRVGFAAREDGSTDISRSDTCEAIYANGDLVRHTSLLDPRFPDDLKLQYMAQGGIPYVFHTGWIHREQRLKQSAFWAPVWRARDNSDKVKELTPEEFDAIEYKPHGLPDWRIDYD